MMNMFNNRAHLRLRGLPATLRWSSLITLLGVICLSHVALGAPKSPFIADQGASQGSTSTSSAEVAPADPAQAAPVQADPAQAAPVQAAPVQAAPTSTGASSAPVSPNAVAEPELNEPPMISDPMQMRFKIKRLERNVSPDARRFSSPRVLTLTAMGPITHLDESVWRGKRLAVFRAGMIDEKVGEIKIKSVYQATLQAEVTQDDLTRGIRDRQGAARVIMIGDVARLEAPIKAPTRRRPRRRAKPRKRGQYERENMQWRL